MNTPAHPVTSTVRVRVLEARPIAASSSFSSPGGLLCARASASSGWSPPLQRRSPQSRQLAPSGSAGASASVRRRGPARVLRLLRVEAGDSCPEA